MRKHIPAVLLALFLCLILCSPAFAATWSIDWAENGSLREEVVVNGHELSDAGQDWQINSSGDKTAFSRQVESWETYNRLDDKLPITATVKNLFFCNIITLTPLAGTQSNTLYSNLDRHQTLRLEMNVPGIIIDSSAAGKEKNTVSWEVAQPGEGLGQDFIFQVILVDGFGLGITILAIGAIILAIFFAARMRKVNRIIDEIYSLDNVTIDDEEDGQ